MSQRFISSGVLERTWSAGRRLAAGAGDLPTRTRSAARQAAWLFIATGLISLCYDLLPNSLGHHRHIAIAVDGLTAAVGIGALLLRWERLSPRSLSVLPVVALLYLAVNRMLGVVPDETYGIWIILIFVWIGLWQPPGTALAAVPVAVATYLLPFAISQVPGDGTLTSVAISVPIATVVGETLSRRTAAVARADVERQAALDALALANVTDDLTGLGNRRRANQMLDALRDGDALAILDLDHFKHVNDTLGHQHGDRVLNELGAFLAEHIRTLDSVARYGGEEFILVLREADGHVHDIVERLLERWRALSPSATLSAGIAVQHGDAWSDTFARADHALYQAKQGGRDRAVLAAR